MFYISFTSMMIFITVIWILLRGYFALKNKNIDWKREIQLLLVYTCIVVISRMVYFPMHLVDGHIQPMEFDASRILPFKHNLRPFFFLQDIYKGWQINVIGNITMFIPVGIVWPICFKELNNIGKVTLAGFVYTLLIEISQLPFYGRCSDVDDMILNTTGVFIGAVIYTIVKALIKRKKR